MSATILATKLYVPPARLKVVLRSRLIARLNEGLQRTLGVTLISASAGSGKTTLVSEWVASCGRPVAWLSLDEGDNDLTRFLTYLVAALQTLALSAADGIAVNLGEGVMRMLQSPQPPPTEAILTALLNDITTVPNQFILVLDDYHVIDAKPIDDALALLIERLPPQIHLVIATREDPQLPLARLRVRGQLTELRVADLRFTSTEAADFLNQVMGLTLSVEDVAALEDRTEGWIAGLQLAALSMRGRADVGGFIRAFAGDNRYVVDYLVEEVLQHQPEPVRSFLLQTAILDRLSGPLCDAVTAREGGKARLEALERGNFFVIPLDNQRHWYRYHHLFAEVLSAHLIAEQPDQISMLHRRASQWYELNDMPSDAIRHALAAEDFARAADLVELAVPAMSRSRQEATVLGWLKALPDEVVHDRPVLSVYYAGTLLQNGELEGIEVRLRDAERWLDTTADMGEQPYPSAAMVVMDREAFRRLPAWIAIYRAGQSLALGDVPDTVKNARRALDLIPDDDHLMRGAATALLGLASWTSGDLETAHQSYADGMAHLQRAGNISDAIGGVIALADIRIAQGRLREAMRTYERALQFATTQGAPALVVRGTADLYVGMSELHREQNDLHAATQHLVQSKALGEHTGFPQNPYRWCVAMAQIRMAQGDMDGAFDLLHQAERLYISDFFPNVRPITALKTRVWVAQGKLGEALGWARGQGLSIEDDLSYLREFEHITLVRVILARSKSNPADRGIHEAMRFLGRLLQAAEVGARMGSVIEILLLQALAHQAQGDISAALIQLKRALMLAEPEGYVRMFVDEGPFMMQLLTRVNDEDVAQKAYIHKLLAAFGMQKEARPSTVEPQPLVEPLSQRELEVLRLFKTELSGPEIARELVIALSTVRTHTKGIYSKLNVTSRRAAVRRATELDLI